MNRPSSTATSVVPSTVFASVCMMLIAGFFPEAYERISAYPGSEAAIAGAVAFVVAWKKRETVYKMSPRSKAGALHKL